MSRLVWLRVTSYIEIISVSFSLSNARGGGIVGGTPKAASEHGPNANSYCVGPCFTLPTGIWADLIRQIKCLKFVVIIFLRFVYIFFVLLFGNTCSFDTVPVCLCVFS